MFSPLVDSLIAIALGVIAGTYVLYTSLKERGTPKLIEQGVFSFDRLFFKAFVVIVSVAGFILLLLRFDGYIG